VREVELKGGGSERDGESRLEERALSRVRETGIGIQILQESREGATENDWGKEGGKEGGNAVPPR